ncbi:MAG TPA: GDSL-type esterase/lipase family protein [Steroidobacteraceae bacterium]|nr:GDSL-type esterase/lipase family protein [Steroidobacteraceae bacterium]
MRDTLRRYGGWLLSATLLLGLGLTSWKMLEFHARLNELENPRWEQRLAAVRPYQNPIVMFGDSQIANWPVASSFGMLPVLNRGLIGDLATRQPSRFEREVVPLNASLVVILIGTNDLAHDHPPQEILKSVADMADRAHGLGSGVVICSLLPARGAPATVRPRAKIEALNQELQQLARAHDAQYVDLYSRLVDDRGELPAALSSDGLHPNAAGYLRMTDELLPVLMRAYASAGHPAPAPSPGQTTGNL